MKPLRYLFVTVAFVLVIPALVAIADGWAWIIFDSTVTAIRWSDHNHIRLLATWIMVVLAAVFFGFGMAIRHAANR